MRDLTFHARDLASWALDQFMELDQYCTENRKSIVVKLDDGDLVTTARATMLSWFFWRVWRAFPESPLLKVHHVGNKYLTVMTSRNILSSFSRTIHRAYGPMNYDREKLWEEMQEATNDAYNYIVAELGPWQTSTNIEHYLELDEHPVINHALENARGTPRGVEELYDTVSNELLNSPALDSNPVCISARCGLIKPKQVLENVAAVGFKSDIDQTVFNKAIMTGYFRGVKRIEDLMKDSRSAAKALAFQAAPLKESEYFNRKMQLIEGSVTELVFGDCRSEYGIKYFVDETLLKHIDGRHAITPTGLVTIDKTDKSWINQTVMLRSPTQCKLRGEGKVCYTCMGEISYSIPHLTSLGHVSATELIAEASQLILSVKHYDGSANVGEIVFDERTQRLVGKGNLPEEIIINSKLKGYETKLILPLSRQNSCKGAEDLLSIPPDTDINLLQVYRLSSFTEIDIETTKDNVRMRDSARISVGPRLGSLSKKMVGYILKHGYELTEDSEMVVDLTHWDFNEAAFVLPLRHISTLEYLKNIEGFLRSVNESNRRRSTRSRPRLIDHDNVDEAVRDLHELVSQKLHVNLHHLEVIVLGLMVQVDEEDNYCLPKYGRPYRFEKYDTLMNNRSAAGLLAYQRQMFSINSPDAFLIKKRPAHLLDYLVLPPSSTRP